MCVSVCVCAIQSRSNLSEISTVTASLILYMVIIPGTKNKIYFLFQKFAARPMQTPQGYSSSAPYVGAGAPSNYMGVPPYGSSLFNQTGMPSYNAPFSGSSNYHYNYDNRMSGGSPFRQLHLSGPTPYSPGAMMGNGIYA